MSHHHHDEHHHHDDHHHHHDDHDHHHHDDHDHHRHEDRITRLPPQDKESPLSFEQKMVKLLSHWIKHNDDHAKTYEEWADQSEKNGLSKVSAVLKEVAEDTKAVSRKFENAASLISNSSSFTD